MTDLNISDSVVMGNIEHKTTCPNCSSISNQIFACKQCKVLFCCNICVTEYKSEKSKKIQHKIGYLDKSIMRTDLSRFCVVCSISYLEKNHCSLLTELTKFNLANSKLFHSLFSDDEFSWEISSLTESQILESKDLIEEIVGDISDEFDYEDIEYSKIDSNIYLFDAKISLNDFYRISKISSIENFEKRRGEAETLGGFLTEISQRLPRIREKISFEKIQFTIESVDKKRIKRVKVKLS